MKVYINNKQIPIISPNKFAAATMQMFLSEYIYMSHAAIVTNFRELFKLFDEYIDIYKEEITEPMQKGTIMRTKKKFNRWSQELNKMTTKKQVVEWAYERLLCLEGLTPI